MFKSDKLFWGFLVGLIAPVLAFISEEVLNFNFQMSGKKDLLYIASAVVNLFMVRIFFKQERVKTAEGVMLSLFTCGLLYYIFKH
jgi:tryptophan-rich sensory protein